MIPTLNSTATYIFNPSTEIALASDKINFTPKRTVVDFERELSLLPALYAPRGSIIIAPHLTHEDDAMALPYYNLLKQRDLRVYTNNSTYDLPAPVYPWGWNRSLQRQLLRYGVAPEHLPSDSALDKIRELASRKTTIDIWNTLIEDPLLDYNYRKTLAQNIPQILRDKTNIEKTLASTLMPFIIKSPWSSSGRGVLICDKINNLTLRHITGCIKFQGAVLLEPLWDKTTDFASEWIAKDGEIRFIGFSLFMTDNTGHYSGNLVSSQQNIIHRLPVDYHILNNIIQALSRALTRIIAPHYEGPLGIDMLSTSGGIINPCVELNLRHTMGHVSLSLWEHTGKTFRFIPGRHVPQFK